MPLIPHDKTHPLYWVYAGLAEANKRLYQDGAFAQASIIVTAYQRDVITALIARTDANNFPQAHAIPIPAMTPEIQTAHNHLGFVEAMATQFQNHLEALEAAPSADRAFWKPERWLDPTPPLPADPGPTP